MKLCKLPGTGDVRLPVAAACDNQEWVAAAPAVLLITVHPDRKSQYRPDRAESFTHQECGAAVENVCLLATSLGVASSWVGAFDAHALAAAAKLPQGNEPLTVVPVGHAEAQ